MKPVVALGDANVDLLIRLPKREPGSSGPLSAEPQIFGGGSVANVAVGLARLGIPTAFIGMIGDDAYGRFVQQDFAAEGVDTAGLCVRRDVWTPTVIAFVDSQGERTISVWPPRGGAHFALRPEDINPQIITGAAWLHSSGMCIPESPAREALLYGMRLAHEAGVPVSFDLNLRLELWGWRDGQRDAVEQAVALADVVFGSAAEEIAPLVGIDDVEAAARTLSANRRTVVARLGAAGAFAVSPTETVRLPAFPVRVVDTLGAGDAFDAGFIAARIEGRSLAEAVRWGNAVAALKIGRPSARGVPTRAELEPFLKRVVSSG